MFFTHLNDANLITEYCAAYPNDIIENKLILTFDRKSGIPPSQVQYCIEHAFQVDSLLKLDHPEIMVMIHAHAGRYVVGDHSEYRITLGSHHSINESNLCNAISSYLKVAPVMICLNTCAASVSSFRWHEAFHSMNGDRSKTSWNPCDSNRMDPCATETKDEKNLSPNSTLGVRFPFIAVGMSSSDNPCISYQSKTYSTVLFTYWQSLKPSFSFNPQSLLQFVKESKMGNIFHESVKPDWFIYE